MTQDLPGKVALVTGASRGIGRAIARELARRGALVGVHYGFRKSEAEETVGMIAADGGRAFIIDADLSETAAIVELARALPGKLAEKGETGLDILVNNAGIGGGGTLGSTTLDGFDKLFAVNVRGMFFVTQELLPLLRDGGRIINISSMVGLAAYPGSLPYGMTKAAVNSFTLSLAAELGVRKITVNAVAPGATETEFIAALLERPDLAEFYANAAALKRIGEPEEIAKVTGFLASPDGGWITGQVLQASGGMHL